MENNEHRRFTIIEEIIKGLKHEHDCMYSQDGKRLLKGNEDVESSTIKEGTEVICDGAFDGCKSLQSIVIPESVTEIGNGAFLDVHPYKA